MKVSLINPPQLNVLDDRQYPPLGLLYVAANLRENGIDVDVIDLASTKPDEWKGLISTDSDIYGIECFTPSVVNVKAIVAICKDLNPDAITIVGGPHASAIPQHTLEYTGSDSVLAGEGEQSFVDFALRLKDTGKYEKIVHGIQIKDLDSLPIPARDLVDHDSYTATLFNKKTSAIITARGCPYSCAFCDNKGVFGGGVRFRNPKKVLSEVNELKEKYGYDSFFVYDDIFAINEKRLDQILPGFKEMGMQFICDGRVNIINLDMLKKLRDGGCVKIAYGIETGSQKILNLMNKQTTVQQCIDAIKAAKDAGIFTKCYFIYGLPGEDERSVDETKKLIEEANPDQANLYTFIPYPGSAIWNSPEKYGIEIFNKDFGNYFMISTDGTGGINYRIDGLSERKYIELRDDLMSFIRARSKNRPEATSNI